MDQIFALRNILEQSLEWNTSLCINFIDFQKAFDSVHRESLWKILQAYGLPPKIIKMFYMYNNFECSIILGNTITETFPVKSRVRQGCILSPILFLVTIDWVMRQATSLRPRGIQWIFKNLTLLMVHPFFNTYSSSRENRRSQYKYHENGTDH